MSNSVLVVVAHPDDEVLGCGGTIASHISRGDSVGVVFLADGVSSRVDVIDSDITMRQQALQGAMEVLGVDCVTNLSFPDNRMDSIPLLDIVQSLEPIIKKLAPSIIYTHHAADLNIDHRITHQAVLTACRPLPNSSVCQIYGMEIVSSTEWGGVFEPALYIDITNFVDKKISALNKYIHEVRPAPHSRSIEHVLALARHRGLSVGRGAAEAFTVIRIIQ